MTRELIVIALVTYRQINNWLGDGQFHPRTGKRHEATMARLPHHGVRDDGSLKGPGLTGRPR